MTTYRYAVVKHVEWVFRVKGVAYAPWTRRWLIIEPGNGLREVWKPIIWGFYRQVHSGFKYIPRREYDSSPPQEIDPQA